MMRFVATTLLLAAALTAHGACFAQSRAPVAELRAEAPAAGEAPDATAVPRSAFGKVMAVMIAALQRQSLERRAGVRPVHTTASGTPLGIEVGAAFREQLQATRDAGAAAPETGTGGADARDARAAPPEEPALRQAALAGPG